MEFYKHRTLKVSAGRLKDMIMDLVDLQPESFKGRFDIPVIVFGHIPPKEQARLAGIDYWCLGSYFGGLDVCDWKADPRGYRTPSGVYVTWMQDGRKNLSRSVEKVRSTLDPDERGATVQDGIGFYIARPNTLTGHYVDLPGTSVGSGYFAVLRLWNAKPALDGRLVGKADPEFGSASCGRNKS